MTGEEVGAREVALDAIAAEMLADWMAYLDSEEGGGRDGGRGAAGRDDVGGGRALPARGPLDAGGEKDAGGVPEAA
ncbi:hypothetical protein Pcatena_04310 [Parolsenella catena]|uniref:Uncharacterized protein n=1 Tax=Parolsenella catena TaxID=2003188 RepID=A0A3G9K6V3_9ACTN|nr:hypothetical protein Pcatena_04310 [Parolsenella catena]